MCGNTVSARRATSWPMPSTSHRVVASRLQHSRFSVELSIRSLTGSNGMPGQHSNGSPVVVNSQLRSRGGASRATTPSTVVGIRSRAFTTQNWPFSVTPTNSSKKANRAAHLAARAASKTRSGSSVTMARSGGTTFLTRLESQPDSLRQEPNLLRRKPTRVGSLFMSINCHSCTSLVV